MTNLIPFPSVEDLAQAEPSLRSVHSLEELRAQGVITNVTPAQEEAAVRHPIALTPILMDLIDPTDPNDPIARQFVPSPDELVTEPHTLTDPIGDLTHSPVKGIVHRYPDRLLLNLSQVCPAYCRFCFRRGRVGAENQILSSQEIEAALSYIREHKEIWEVIFSGGEPLMLSVRRLREVLMELRGMDHVRALRLHTRAPITMPEHITPELAKLLGGSKPVALLIHCNHPKELSSAARSAIARLADAGLPLYSQSVLLKGVNADLDTLTELMHAFVENRIKPHYLHHPDMVAGTHAFRVSLAEGRDLVMKLQGRLSGLCQPHYMLEIPGGAGKVNALSPQVQKSAHGWVLTNYKGEGYFYEG